MDIFDINRIPFLIFPKTNYIPWILIFKKYDSHSIFYTTNFKNSRLSLSGKLKYFATPKIGIETVFCDFSLII